jgi:hypothetical protein
LRRHSANQSKKTIKAKRAGRPDGAEPPDRLCGIEHRPTPDRPIELAFESQ